MESRFAHLRQRDTSVSMLRTKMSRRRSQSQKENRERTVNTRRQLSALDKIEEIKPASSKVEDRLKQLERWKERKALEKEKTKRDKERKGVFKTGLYHPKDTLDVAPLPDVPGASSRTRGKKLDSCQSTRVTRSMKQQPLRVEDPNIGPKKAQPAVERSSRTRGAAGKPAPVAAKTSTCGAARALPTRSATRPPAAAARPEKDQSKSKSADVRTTRSRAVDRPEAPSAGGEKKINEPAPPAVLKEEPPLETAVPQQEEVPDAPACPQEGAMAVEDAPPVDPAQPLPSRISFAPAGFVFQAPVGLPAFKFDPMTPRSADAFLTPSPTLSVFPLPVYTDAPQAEPGKPSPPASPSGAPCSPLESKHDVPYFRSEITSETERLTTFSLYWESKVEDESIPEEMRDRMRTAVGQARLLMKERFNQFAGLVDDCELRRGDKVTTCTDLQGFWDMVSYQVEDVKKKFDALREAEGRGWVEEHRPPPRQRKAVKKPAAPPAKAPGDKAAGAKSRLAAVKAAMKARRQAAEAEKEDEAEDNVPLNPGRPQTSPAPQALEGAVFDGGFFKVESPVKPPGSVRRSSRLSAAALPPPSICSTYLSPRRVTRRSLALVQTPARPPASPARPPASPARPPASPARPPASPARPPASPARPPASPAPPQFQLLLQQTPAPGSQGVTPLRDAGHGSLCFSPVNEAFSGGGPAGWEEGSRVPQLLTIGVVDVEMETTETVGLRHPPGLPTPSPSPGGGPTHPLPHSPAVVSSPAQQSLCLTPDGLPGLDFERYLQPSLRGSPSPLETDCSDVWSPAAVDVEMTSPTGERDDPAAQDAPATPAMSSVLSLQSPQVHAAASPMLLFTPDIKDKIRQSVCPSDLMVFTPPSL